MILRLRLKRKTHPAFRVLNAFYFQTDFNFRFKRKRERGVTQQVGGGRLGVKKCGMWEIGGKKNVGGGRWENNVGGGRLVYKMWEM